ncbi:sigma-70 family RNA polymerase sigma factor [Achromobacter deleyi]|uniref:sigma-70 family RNA polymerase sigma factor n=1 Tax=Achromobacter deleyi TaxID=1353891 RepID=UPI0014930508|nr:sigma-70 family RNA polymerase sigma factor [Achromobacter deleyi]QVQ26853.1 sigma-70 family RNA polymerase sigma factor [Achromobacter deleyi]UIP22428.1 sigma-70 family RNA polymerase sigma factor [Achromobacter deleyi]
MPDALHLQALLDQCADKRESALAELYRLASPHLFALARRMLRDQAAAEDVLQECFVIIWRQAGQYRAERSQAMTWMTRIVRNRCIDRLRRPDREVPDPDDSLTLAMADEGPGPLAQLQASQDGRRLADCMGQLEGSQRVAIAMAFFDDLAHPDIAARLGTPLGTIKSWIRRGLQRLKRCLE